MFCRRVCCCCCRGSGYPTTVLLRENHTRAVYVGLNVPAGTAPGEYKGTLTITSDAEGSGSTTTTVDIILIVWPIDADCVAAETKAFGAAYGFDHAAVGLLYPDKPGMHATMREFTNRHHVSSNSLDLWEDGNNVTSETIAELLQAQVRKPPFLRHFYIEIVRLPRQARDKHRKTVEKPEAFSAGVVLRRRNVPHAD